MKSTTSKNNKEMNKTIKNLALLCAVLGLASCNNEDTPVTQPNANLNPQEFLNISYNGKEYSNIPTTYDENGEFIFLDKDFSKIYEGELKDLSTLSIHLNDESSIEMFKTLDDNLEKHGVEISSVPMGNDVLTRTGVSSEENFLGTVDLWDDKKFKDTYWQFGIMTATNPKWVENLGSPYKFNDKCSSLILTNNLPNDSSKELNMGSYTLKYSEATLVFIGYDDRGYSDRTFTALAKPTEKKEFRELKNFNDKMSSLKLFFARTGVYTTEGASK